ncbi:hypothetical protein WJX84_008507 [Apatococcus fuscideae]|uniref:PDEase domain-containing protein n=1 Tax=Apatococcus fuscideae TaxID=2026836 RepID=A0AAW1T1Y1_9CHLO
MTAAESVLSDAHTWSFDAFALDEATDGHPLSILGFHLIKQAGFISLFELNEQRLVNFLRQIEHRYQDNPYHNRAHAADVLQSTHAILYGSKVLHENFVEDREVLACYLAAMVHDAEHPGVTNDFLVKTSHHLALRYNDRSPLENHHLYLCFRTIHQDKCNFFSGSSQEHELLPWLRKIVIEMVLATDMKQHFHLVSRFRQLILHRALSDVDDTDGEEKSDSVAAVSKSLTGSASWTQLRDLAQALDNREQGNTHIRVDTNLDESEKVLMFQMVMKCADIGHLTQPRDIHRAWVSSLEEEFFRQGDLEKGNDLPASPLMDRSKSGITQTQASQSVK